MVLRAADPQAATLDMHTDLRSAKVAALRLNPLDALHVWDETAHLQTRITASVEVLSAEAVSALWLRVPETSQSAYGTMPAPGTATTTSLGYSKTPDPAAFAVLHCTVLAVDAVHLGPNYRRARFDRADDWRVQWLAP